MNHSGIWAAVPVKTFRNSKTRLSDALSRQHRQDLCENMLRDVLAALCGCAGIAGALVVTRDADAINIARQTGARVLYIPNENGPSHAVAMAARLLADEGRPSMLAMMGDVPLVSREEIRQLLAVHEAAPAATLVPSRNGLGTNAVLCSPPDLVPFRFDGRGLRHNQAVAAGAGVSVRVERLGGLGLDIDTPDDLDFFAHAHAATMTAAFLRTEADTVTCPQPPHRPAREVSA